MICFWFGGRPRGTLYSVYTFLEDTLGCRWWTSSESYIPKQSPVVIGALNIRYTPQFYYRETFYTDVYQHPDFAVKLKDNGHHDKLSPALGGNIKIIGFVHTFDQLIPAKTYMKDHPEWFSLINGKRYGGQYHGQLCCCNQGLRKALTDKVLQRLRTTDNPRIISVSQNDNINYCRCPACQALIKKEGSASAPLLSLVNHVAEAVEKEFPHVWIDTLAYKYSCKPPKTLRPRHNVIIRLCSIGCDFSRPFTDQKNITFQRDIMVWSDVSKQLLVWNYAANFSNYLLPHPTIQSLGLNMRFLAAHKVRGVFEQGSYGSILGDMVHLRAWVTGHLLWNPQLDADHLIDTFLRGYYGKAAPFIKRYLTRIQNAAEHSGKKFHFLTPDYSWLTPQVEALAQQDWDQAEAAVKDNPILSGRVRRDRLPVTVVGLEQRRAKRLSLAVAGKPLPPDPEALQQVRELIELGKQYHEIDFREGYKFSGYAQNLLRAFSPVSGKLPQGAVDLSSYFQICRIGGWGDFVKDPSASYQPVACITRSGPWVLQCPLPDELEKVPAWHCYAAVRCNTPDKRGKVGTIGIYNKKQSKTIMRKHLMAEMLSGSSYHVVDLGIHPLDHKMYFWATLDKPKASLFIDSIYALPIYSQKNNSKQ